MPKTKVLFITSTLRSSGPINIVFDILKYLDKDSFEPMILTLSAEPKNSQLERFQSLDLPIHSLNLSRIKGLFLAKSALNAFIDEHQPDVIHSHGIRPDSLSLQCLDTCRRISTIHNNPYEDYPLKFGRFLGTYMAWKHTNIFRKIDFAVAISETLAQGLLRYRIQAQPIILNGVDQDSFYPIPEQEQLLLRDCLNLSKDKTIVVSVGQLILRKDPQTLIKGFLQAKHSEESILVIIGDGVLRDQCQQLSRQTENIQFTGKINNVSDYLRVADCFVSASLSEGMPCSVLEALACGVPVCLSDISPHREILKNSRDAGELFPVAEPETLASQLDYLIASKNGDGQSTAAVAVIEQSFNARRMSQQYQDLYLGKSRDLKPQ